MPAPPNRRQGRGTPFRGIVLPRETHYFSGPDGFNAEW